jgi:hypothetical protein
MRTEWKETRKQNGYGDVSAFGGITSVNNLAMILNKTSFCVLNVNIHEA